jgi:hypothetical protein
MSQERLTRAFNLAYECLRGKINGGRIHAENEASLQLQFAAILKSVGELLEVNRDEFFSIELEKPVSLTGARATAVATSLLLVRERFRWNSSSSSTASVSTAARTPRCITMPGWPLVSTTMEDGFTL